MKESVIAMWDRYEEAPKQQITPVIESSGFSYLASRYTAKTKREMHENYLSALHATAWLLRQKIWVYSPILHCHETARLHNMPTDFEFWLDYNHTMIDKSNGIIVLQNRDWRLSKGVQEEINYAFGKDMVIKGLILSLKEEYVLLDKIQRDENTHISTGVK